MVKSLKSVSEKFMAAVSARTQIQSDRVGVSPPFQQ